MGSHRSRLSFLKVFLCTLTIFLFWVIGPQPLQAQSGFSNSSNEAPVVLDGHVLFQVRKFQGKFQDFSAQVRAEQVNRSLAESLRNPEIINTVFIDEEGSELVLKLRQQLEGQRSEDDQYLLTITQADLLPGVNAWYQARDWRNKINKALVQSRQERTPAYIRLEVGKCLAVSFSCLTICLRQVKIKFKRQCRIVS